VATIRAALYNGGLTPIAAMTTPDDQARQAADAADAARFRRRLYLLGAVALAGLAVLTARLIVLQMP
jgi:hypothetical protein